MKRVLLIGLIAILNLLSCSEDKKVEVKPTPDTQVKSTAQVDPKTAKLDALKKSTPADLADMQKMLPEEMGGIKRSKFSMTSNLGYATATADYNKNSKTYIHLVMYDCTGDQGSNLFNDSYLTHLDKNEENADGYRKTIDFMGGKAVEHYEGANKITTLSFLANDKILVVVSGKNIPAETLREAAKNLNLKVS
jgi:hypothetical protein